MISELSVDTDTVAQQVIVTLFHGALKLLEVLVLV